MSTTATRKVSPWAVPILHMKLVGEAIAGVLGTRFDKPGRAGRFGAFVKINWSYYRGEIIIDDHGDREHTTYVLRNLSGRSSRWNPAAFELWEVRSGRWKRYTHPKNNNPSGYRLRKKDLKAVLALIMYLPMVKAEWWADWGKPKNMKSKKEPLTYRLASQIYDKLPDSRIHTLEERQEIGREMVLNMVLSAR